MSSYSDADDKNTNKCDMKITEGTKKLFIFSDSYEQKNSFTQGLFCGLRMVCGLSQRDVMSPQVFKRMWHTVRFCATNLNKPKALGICIRTKIHSVLSLWTATIFYVIYFTQHDVNDLHFYEHLHVKKSFLKHEFTAIYLLFWLLKYFLLKFISRCWSLYKPHMEIRFNVCFVYEGGEGWKCT